MGFVWVGLVWLAGAVVALAGYRASMSLTAGWLLMATTLSYLPVNSAFLLASGSVRPLPSWGGFRWALMYAVAGAIGSVASWRAYREFAPSAVVAVTATSPVAAAVALSLFGWDSLGPRQWAGVVLAAVGVGLVVVR